MTRSHLLRAQPTRSLQRDLDAPVLLRDLELQLQPKFLHGRPKRSSAS